MKFSSLFSPIAGAFRAAVLALSKVDGKPGLSSDDFSKVIEWTVNLRKSTASNADKAIMIAEQIVTTFGVKLPNWSWLPAAIGWIAHIVAKRIKPPAK